jgi:hypothetical protein
MLTAEQAELWQKILNFQLDDPDAAFKFSGRLAQENGWNSVYTRRVIAEYKHFIFLCCISEHGVTPSDAVDQAWHLHLTFTRSYWIDLCRDTLGREIHHNPTKGGNNEAVKYDAFYTDTNKLYEEAFQSQPPLDIWPDNALRFTDIDFQRINTRRNWVIPKPKIKVKKLWALLALLIISATISIQAINNETFVICFLGFFIVLAIVSYKQEGRNKNDNGNNSGNGCNTATCGADSGYDPGHHGHSDHDGQGCHGGGDGGCGSGCSGCSASGCSGCSSH